MTSTNMGGTSDTGQTNNPTRPDAGALPTDATRDALGEPVDVVEVVEVQTYEPTPSGYDAGEGDAANGFGFRWWMVPAVAVPIAAGVTAAVLVVLQRRRRPQPPHVVAYNKLARQSRDWMGAVRGSQATRSASRALAQGVESVRGAARSVPGIASTRRGRAGDLLGVVATSAAARQATGSFKGAVDSVTGFWNTSVPRAQQTLMEQGRRAPAMVGAARAGVLNRFSRGMALPAVSSARASKATAKTSKAANRAGKLSDAAKPAATAAAVKAARAAKQANRAAKRAGKRAGKRANNAVKRTRAFTFGMLVAALATYWRAWQRRLREKETRETSGGRMVSA